jgi:hypothetical protein
MRFYLNLFLLFAILGCNQLDSELTDLRLVQASIADNDLSLSEPYTEELPVDRPISLDFSAPLDPATVSNAVTLFEQNNPVEITTNLISNNQTLVIRPTGILNTNTTYRLVISDQLQGANGSNFSGEEIKFRTQVGSLQIQELTIENANELASGRITDVPLEFSITVEFSDPIDPDNLRASTRLNGPEAPDLVYNFSEDQRTAIITGATPLQYLRKYDFEITSNLTSADGGAFAGESRTFYSEIDETPKFPVISQDELLTKVQEHTFRYFWDFAHEASGLARERNTSGNLVTIGGSGFGAMAVIVGVERGFITRQQAVERWARMVDFLMTADRFHGVWPHWLNGDSGSTIPFSAMDDGGDLVETAFMIQGLLTVRAYLDGNRPEERAIMDNITQLWHEVEWDWYTRGGQDVLFWHWSPEHNWGMNLPINGYNECLITYVLAAASPTHPIDKTVYDKGWARSGAMANGKSFYDIPLPLGEDFGGPLFFAHYSYLGLDPRNLQDQYANYWEQNRNHSLVNRAYCMANPSGFVGYGESNWGLTASDNHMGYSAHSPRNDLGVITPTAALSSFPYTPEESMEALEFFYYTLGDRIWDEYGFHDAFNITEEWYADSYLAIDQGPIILMIENHRTGLLWDLLMTDPEVRAGLDRLNFTY